MSKSGAYTDLNTITEYGWYDVNTDAGSTNSPIKYGSLLVWGYLVNFQLCIGHSSGQSDMTIYAFLRVHVKSYGRFSEWKRLV